ncbi:hypothetical protein [Agriterribacter sp.]|uniref:hypothetical protein n=1 Tax=Agriterribacter sp. TaxID=2821509 RepID=UPI002CAEBBC9|nr:hypothetical protein [Agriterribacter sp.]HRP55877.1 hypothetical protein [Agriterribacter sp.]
MHPKVGKNKPQDKNTAIASAKETAEKSVSSLINFSLKYFDTGNVKFPCSCWDGVYYLDLFSRIKDLCLLQKLEFTSNRSKTLRSHPIKWQETTENGFGFPMEEQIVDVPYQFSLSANDKGRVHGFFISNTFYVVWLDKNHALYP